MEQEATKTLNQILDENHTYAEMAVNNMGGPAEAGRTLTERCRARGDTDKNGNPKKISIGTIWAWLNRDKRGIPLEFLVDVEEESGISREQLRADVPWHDIEEMHEIIDAQ